MGQSSFLLAEEWTIMFLRSVLVILLFFSCLVSSQFSRHGFPRGYRNGRTWGTGPQRTAKSFNQRRARQFEERMSACSSCSASQLGSAVCGSDGRTYDTECDLKKAGCKNVRRQGRSFQSDMLKIEVAHQGACEEPCPGMDGMGHFQAFNTRATNTGLCVHDFFRCANKMRGKGMGNTQTQTCCQKRFDACN